MPAFVVSCAAAYRLAKFNLDETQSYHFIGLPTPAVGLLIASFPLILHFNALRFGIGNFLINKWVLYGLIILLSYLMVSNLPMMAMKFNKKSTLRDNPTKLILLLIAMISAGFLQWIAIPVIFISYILLSLLNKNKIQ